MFVACLYMWFSVCACVFLNTWLAGCAAVHVFSNGQQRVINEWMNAGMTEPNNKPKQPVILQRGQTD